MGQKVHPIGFRVGVYRSWPTRWFARRKNEYAYLLLEDIKIRNFIKKNFGSAEVSQVEIERAGDNVKVIIVSARPGVIIGKKGSEIDSLRKALSRLLNRPNVEVSVQEVKNPEFDATIVSASIAEQLEKRGNFKKAMKKAAMSTMKAGARGIKIRCSGRLGGAEIAREEWLRNGSIPSQTLRADIDYGFTEAHTTYGVIGVKVWICRGEYKL